jgi:aromatic-L-amino-acid decarboxylase
MLPEQRPRFSGWERADSIVLNPHKWLATPVDCSLLLFRDPDPFRASLALTPEYLTSDDEAEVNLHDYGLSMGRRFRALKLWFVLRLDGVASIQDRIRRDVALTQELAGWIADDDRFEIVAPHPLNLVCLRVTNDDSDSGAATDALISRINDAAEFHVTRTVLDGRVALRVSIGARTTERENVEALWTALGTALGTALS